MLKIYLDGDDLIIQASNIGQQGKHQENNGS